MSSDFEIEVRAYGKPSYALKFGPREAEMAREWASIAHNRRRWQQAEPLLKKIRKQAEENWKFSKEQFRAMTATGLIEIGIPWADTPEAQAARAAPWEFIISSVVRGLSPDASVPTVVRHLQTGKREQPSPVARPHLFVKSAPPPFEQAFAFDSEQQLVEASLKPAEVKLLNNPSLAELQREVQTSSPAIVHISGVDNIQGASILKSTDPVTPGMYFQQDAAPVPVPAKDVAAAVAGQDGKRPFLVSYNMYHSSASLAAATVASGAWAAIGFQDEFDDALAEIFFTNFYLALQQSGHDLLSAFRVAFHEITSHRRGKQTMQGTSIVLWTAGSLLSDAEGNHVHAVAQEVQQAQAKVTEMKAEVIRDDPRSVLSYDIKPLEALNYCLLHNGGSMFETFTLRKPFVGTLPAVNVEVQLQVQGDKFSYEELRDVVEFSEPVRPCISLTSGLSRQLRERIQTSVLVCISCAGRQLYRRTHSVGLLATDEWENTDANRKWLPSFVLPRDPAVDRIIRLALPFLIALTDRHDASFSGYQEKDREVIDKQVQAVWWSLVHQLAVNYIAPPPTFTVRSQRLRGPSAVLEGNSGTCIDLALLLAACLEYVQLRPVVFLQFGHAYTGYLRSEDDYQEFRALFQAGAESASPAAEGTRSTRLQTPWVLEEDQYFGIGRLIDEKKLVPLDTVKLTSRESYAIARNQGEDRFLTKDQFQAVYDICEARIRGVTPLPL